MPQPGLGNSGILGDMVLGFFQHALPKRQGGSASWTPIPSTLSPKP